MTLSDVCQLRTSGLSCLGRPLIGTEVAHVNVTRTPLLWLVVLVGQHGHTVMATSPYAYMTYIVSQLAGLGGGISWRPPTYSLFKAKITRFSWTEICYWPIYKANSRSHQHCHTCTAGVAKYRECIQGVYPAAKTFHRFLNSVTAHNPPYYATAPNRQGH